MSIAHIPISDYTYNLPEHRIALHPLPERDHSKLLVYKNGCIEDDVFYKLPNHLPKNTLLVFNETKVMPARLLFSKPTGGVVEIFCLGPSTRYKDITSAMSQIGEVWWECMVGGAKKWKEGAVALHYNRGGKDWRVWAFNEGQTGNVCTVRFEWEEPNLPFAGLLDTVGKVPLPPYIKRGVEDGDKERYQTVYARHDGSVAAPTAGLHFTSQLLNKIGEAGITMVNVTLHVGAGTFLPVKEMDASKHAMHSETIEISRETLLQLIETTDSQIVAVGTTSVRTLESLYWLGVKMVGSLERPDDILALGQWEAYTLPQDVQKNVAVRALLDFMDKWGLLALSAKTGIMITPLYRMRLVKGLITNFHQPSSTLLLLVSSVVGEDWKRIYDHALEHDYRFLSYGDSSLLWVKEE